VSTETFRRLPEEKRRRILEAAWAEFSTVSFSDASINQIIRRAGIPRGSFYQYFEDKDDLFVYLMEQVRLHLLTEYRTMVARAGGDIFETQLLCYDRFVQQRNDQDPMFARLLQVLRLNSGLHLHMMLMDQSHFCMLDAALEEMDVSGLRSQDREFVRHLFFLTLTALGAAVMDAMKSPEKTARYREDLADRLEIIKYGSLAPDRRADG
jgi:AcrR family transcriptional regulator